MTRYQDMNRNPTGKGGFQERPQDRNPGPWSKDNSFSYWLNFFKTLPPEEFKTYPTDHPMTMAAVGAYARIERMAKGLDEFNTVANRTEGMPKQAVEQTTTINYAPESIEEAVKNWIRLHPDKHDTIKELID